MKINRRTALGTIAAAFGGTFLFPSESQGIEIEEITERKHLIQTFRDMRAFVKRYPGARVLSADFPRECKIGYMAYKKDIYGNEIRHISRFPVHIHMLKGFLLEHQQILGKLILNQAGRIKIAKELEKTLPFWSVYNGAGSEFKKFLIAPNKGAAQEMPVLEDRNYF